VALSLEDRQSQHRTDHLPPSDWEMKVAWSCMLSYPCPYVPSWHVIAVFKSQTLQTWFHCSRQINMDIKKFQLLYLCSVIPHYFHKHFNKYLSETFPSSAAFCRDNSVEVTVQIETDLYLLLVKVMVYTRLAINRFPKY